MASVAANVSSSVGQSAASSASYWSSHWLKVVGGDASCVTRSTALCRHSTGWPRPTWCLLRQVDTMRAVTLYRDVSAFDVLAYKYRRLRRYHRELPPNHAAWNCAAPSGVEPRTCSAFETLRRVERLLNSLALRVPARGRCPDRMVTPFDCTLCDIARTTAAVWSDDQAPTVSRLARFFGGPTASSGSSTPSERRTSPWNSACFSAARRPRRGSTLSRRRTSPWNSAWRHASRTWTLCACQAITSFWPTSNSTVTSARSTCESRFVQAVVTIVSRLIIFD